MRLPTWIAHLMANGELIQQSDGMAWANGYGMLFWLHQAALVRGTRAIPHGSLIGLDALLHEHVRGYQRLFPATHPFWDHFRGCWQEALGLLASHTLTSDVPPSSAGAVSPIPRITAAAVALLLDRPSEIPQLTRLSEEEFSRDESELAWDAALRVFAEDGYAVAFNPSTGGVFLLDEVAARSRNRIVLAGAATDANADDELLAELRRTGAFDTGPELQRPLAPPLTSLYLNIAGACNLRCVYCFASQGRYVGDQTPMTAEVGERAVDLLLRESQERTRVSVMFFGGEPLTNAAVLVHLVKYGRRRAEAHGKYIRFDVTTNGTLLPDSVVGLLQRERVGVIVSLDGPPEVQDRQRPGADGRHTYDRVLRNIRCLQEAGVRVSGLNATVARLQPSPVAVLAHLAGLNAGPVHMIFSDPTRDDRQPWQLSDLPALMRSQDELAEFFMDGLRRGQAVAYANLVRWLIRLATRSRFAVHCSAGAALVGVMADGTIYPCSRFAEEPALAVGTVWTGLDRAALNQYVGNSVDGHLPCRACWARYLCGGDCLYSNLLYSGNITQPDPLRCSLIRHEIETAIRTYGRIAHEMPELLKRLEDQKELANLLDLEGAIETPPVC